MCLGGEGGPKGFKTKVGLFVLFSLKKKFFQKDLNYSN